MTSDREDLKLKALARQTRVDAPAIDAVLEFKPARRRVHPIAVAALLLALGAPIGAVLVSPAPTAPNYAIVLPNYTAALAPPKAGARLPTVPKPKRTDS
ncbi:MAG: hypothetical protein AAFQ73_00150 [Pseudomonadota bacterium]